MKSKFLLTDFFWIIFLSIFFLVGALGISYPKTREMTVSLSAGHLLLTFLVLFLSRKTMKNQFILFAFLLFLTGIFVEIIGTKTGYLFGNYHYGRTLGIGILGVPLIIGVNWATTVFCSAALVANWKTTVWVKAVSASFFMTILDVFIEPVAMNLDFWQWQNNEVPFYNYFCWFVISFPMHLFYFKWNLVENNIVHKSVYILMLLFFVNLNWI